MVYKKFHGMSQVIYIIATSFKYKDLEEAL